MAPNPKQQLATARQFGARERGSNMNNPPW
jgi:hypothetical protein